MAMKAAVTMKGLTETTLKIGTSKGDQEEKGLLLLNVAVEEGQPAQDPFNTTVTLPSEKPL